MAPLPFGGAAPGRLSAATLLTATASSPDGWTTYHGSDNRSGYSPLGGPTLATQTWSACLSSYHLRAGPVVDGDRLYVADDLGTVFAVNLSANGSVLWNRTVGVEPVTPEIVGDELLVASARGNLSAFNATTGTPLWQLNLGSAVVQGITVANGAIVVGTTSGLIEAFAVASGSALWRQTLSQPVGGAISADGGRLFVVGANGTLEALSDSGTVDWSTSVGAGVATAPAAGGGVVVVGDLAGRVSAFSESDGHLEWVRSGALGGHADSIHATPALTPQSVFAQLDSGSVLALNRTTGAVEWETGGEFSPFENLAAPLATSNALYVVANGVFELWRMDPATGAVEATAALGTYAFASPALSDGSLYAASDGGCLTAYGRAGGPFRWSVTGTVSAQGGGPIAGALVSVGGALATTAANGSFAFALANGSYPVEVDATGYAPDLGSLVVDGPVPPLAIVLAPLWTYPVTGTVESAASGAPIAGVTVTLVGPYGFTATAVSDPQGAFALTAPNGTSVLSTPATGPYRAASRTVVVDGQGISDVRVEAALAALAADRIDPSGLAFTLPLLAIAVALGVVAAGELSRRRVAAGLPPSLLSPFARYVVMRAILIPVQTILLLAVLYFFGTVLVDFGLHRPPGILAPGVVSPTCTWSDLACTSTAFFWGFGTLIERLFTGAWGYAVYADLREPVTQFLAWWLPSSLELGAIALAISAAVAYPIALRAGWRPEGVLDPVARVVSAIGLFLPSFLVGLLLVLGLAPPLRATFGDSPFGELPSTAWFVAHGGYPSWVGVGSTTSPTGLPLVDGLLHGDLAFEGVVLAKTLLQAAAIASVYVAVFLRHARHLVADAAREPHIAAARARGVDERRLLWTHTGRRVLPIFVLLMGLTLPVFIGTQAVVETIFDDPGFGTIFFLELTHLQQTPLGFTGPLAGNFYQVAVFLLILLVLGATLASDVLARALDPRERRRA